MASTPDRVHDFLEEVWKVSRPAADRELKELQEFASEVELKQWDYSFYAEKLKQQKYQFDEEALRSYFSLDRVIQGVFEHARRLYGLEFAPRKDLPAYHPDVQVFEVRDLESKEFVGLFYADFFPRPSKRGGAWMTTFLEQGLFRGNVVRPHVSIVCNLSKPTSSRPSLLTLDEVRTLFHEFGHALHALLSKCHSVARGNPCLLGFCRASFADHGELGFTKRIS